MVKNIDVNELLNFLRDYETKCERHYEQTGDECDKMIDYSNDEIISKFKDFQKRFSKIK